MERMICLTCHGDTFYLDWDSKTNTYISVCSECGEKVKIEQEKKMSMNLCFTVVGSKEWIDFPFQTSSALTARVLNAGTVQERMSIVKDYIYNDTGWDEEDKVRIWTRCWGLMNSAHLELGMI